MDRPPLGGAKFLGIAVTTGSQGLELAEGSGRSLEEKRACPRHLESKQRPSPVEVDEIQTVGPEAGSNSQIEGVEIGRAVAPDREINIASRSCPPLDRRTEENKKLEIRHRPRKIGELSGDKLLDVSRLHAVTLSDPSYGVKKGMPADDWLSSLLARFFIPPVYWSGRGRGPVEEAGRGLAMDAVTAPFSWLMLVTETLDLRPRLR